MVSGLYLCGSIAYNVFQAARGRRSWKRVGKNLTEEVASVSAGAIAGIAVTALLVPLTGGISLICGALIGISANLSTRVLAKRYTGRLFGIPEDEMLEKAYATLNKPMLVANNEISKAYREKSRQFHPDKIDSKYPNASEELKIKNLMRYLKVQAAFGMIMAARSNDIDAYENARNHFEKIEESELLEKNHIDIALKVWATNQTKKLWSFLVRSKNACKYPAITNGYLPYEFFENCEVEEAMEAVVG